MVINMKKINVNRPFKANVLACGAHLKGSFCLGQDNTACMSNSLGSLQEADNFIAYERQVTNAIKQQGFKPQVIAADAHPEYLSTKFAADYAQKEGGIKLVPVQHHYAHITSCMADNESLPHFRSAESPHFGSAEGVRVIGVAFDGTGLGTDGKIWGGEFLVCNYAGFERVAHFKYMPMPGGEAAIREPRRMAYVYMKALSLRGAPSAHRECGQSITFRTPDVRKGRRSNLNLSFLDDMLRSNINCPVTSSAGRVFDAVSSMLGLCHVQEFEAQAAIELEKAAGAGYEGEYEFELVRDGGVWIIDIKKMIQAIADDVERGAGVAAISGKFHNTMARIIEVVCGKIREEKGLDTAALSGGVFQNKLLTRRACEYLKASGFKVLLHNQVPCHDGGIALGQAIAVGVNTCA